MKNSIQYLLGVFCVLAISISCQQESVSNKKLEIYSIVPESVYPGDEVVIYGLGFSDDINVCFDNQTAEVLDVSDEKMTVVIPQITKNELKISSGEQEVIYTRFRVMSPLSVTDIFPLEVTYGGVLTITGTGFDSFNIYNNIVSLILEDGKEQQLPLISADSDCITASVEELFTGPAKVKISIDRQNFVYDNKTLTFVSDSRIDNISPRRGGAGALVTITGMNFVVKDKELNSVTCGDVPLEVVEVKDRTQMTVKIPSGLNKFDYIKVQVPGQETPSVSPEKFRYDAAIDYDWGYKGISYGAVNMSIPLTKGAVDSMRTMGVSFITLRSGYGASEGLATGTIPEAVHVILDNVVKIKKFSDGKIKTIFSVEHNKNLGGIGYPSVSESSIRTFFENLKKYEYDGVSAWDCIDGIQILGNTNHLNVNSTEAAVSDFIEHVLKPIYSYIHPDGFCKTGEKILLGVPAMVEDKTALIKPAILNSTGYKNWIDVYMMLFNQGNPGGNKYYSLSLPETIFDGRWTNLAVPAVNSDPDNPVSFMNIDLNINGPTAKYQKVDDLGRALTHIIRMMGEDPLFKGYAYRSFLENNVGIRSQTNNLDPRSPDNKETPQISFYEMYKSLPIK